MKQHLFAELYYVWLLDFAFENLQNGNENCKYSCYSCNFYVCLGTKKLLCLVAILRIYVWALNSSFLLPQRWKGLSPFICLLSCNSENYICNSLGFYKPYLNKMDKMLSLPILIILLCWKILRTYSKVIKFESLCSSC